MAKAEQNDQTDPMHYIQLWQNVLKETTPLLKEYMTNFQPPELLSNAVDFEDFATMLSEFWAELLQNPDRLYEMQQQYWQDWSKIWQESAERFFNMTGDAKEQHINAAQDLLDEHKNDRRFKDPAWQESILFDFIKKSYFLTADWLLHLTDEADHLDDKLKRRLQFYMRQYADAIAPSNFPLTNPEVLKKTLETGGENLIHGYQNLLKDIKRGHGKLKISTTDEDAFKIGENIATTDGEVVFENELIQLIQYKPTTAKQFETPLLIAPPFINKFYILDLKEENSFVKWALDQGHSVFLISWVNPDKTLSHFSFGDYMERGMLTALDEVERITGQKQTNVIGYCIGGTLLSITLSWLQAKYKDTSRIKSATFFTTLIDFRDSGDLNVFIDPETLDEGVDTMNERGFLKAEALHQTFALLRANDMIWSFIINNYMLGKEPFPFDLLYWNDDPTNIPAELYHEYLKNMYVQNDLCQKNKLTIKGQKLDITSFDTPCHFISAKDDHIAPWIATYNGAKKLKKAKFTLSGSGHIAGIINPPIKKKYGYWSSDKRPESAEEWMIGAEHNEGSWWPHWHAWISEFTGKQTAPYKPKKGIEKAPGSYVKLRYEDIDKSE
ncbi:MAG: class I poly(R)-hydroxyalkanoic acid synthase [Alphaproteobacteria bacterium]|nr:class I poly(R)-hydroxyalkanoic acid synthase [Alphaproteobacteria bacterium]